jgi:non-specific protein-tyrosine kinase
LQANYASLLTSSQQGAINTLTVIEAATVPTTPIDPNTLRTVLAATTLGFIVGAAAAYLLEILDVTIKIPEDILSVANLPTLAGIAVLEEEKNREYPLITLIEPRSPVSEAYRTLRTAILFANVDQTTRTMLITSANPAEGKSSVVANLGVVMAQAGHRVLVIDADLRRPVQHIIFGILSNNYGMTNLLVQMLVEDDSNRSRQETQVLLEGAIHETRQPSLYVLTSGSLPPNPAELVGSAKMHALLDKLSELFDYVIIDGPPVLAVTDPVVLSTRSDSVLLVSSAGQTRRTQLRLAIEQLREVNANMIGVVLNRVSAKTSGYYYYDNYSSSYYQIDASSDSRDGKVRVRRRKKEKVAPSNGERIFGYLTRIFGQ